MITADDLWQLLPAIHRLRDARAAGDPTAEGGALRDLIGVLAAEADVVDADLERLGDAWFIETCAPWLVPYLGDLLGVRPIHPVGPAGGMPRSYVANTVAYRRRKGTAAVLEQLTHDVTGWPALAVEYFTRLGTTQHQRHVRPDNVRTPSLRHPGVAELADGPFDTAPRTAEVRRIATGRGRFNLPNVGLHVWRLQPHPVERAHARLVEPAQAGWSFDALGRDVPLWNTPAERPSPTGRPAEADLPVRLRRAALRDELAARRDGASSLVWFPTEAEPVLAVEQRADGGQAFEPIAPERLCVADLSLWQRPPVPGGDTDPLAAVDPELGRITFPDGHAPHEVRVSYAAAAPGEIGGGPYDRSDLVDTAFADRVGWRAVVSTMPDPPVAPDYASLREAAIAWNTQLAGDDAALVGEIVIADSGVYLLEGLSLEDDPDPQGLTGVASLQLSDGAELRIVAATVDGDAAPAGVRPVLAGNVSMVAPPGSAPHRGRLVLDGLWINGTLTARVGDLGELRLVDCTVPQGLTVNSSEQNHRWRNTALRVSLDRTVTGPLELAEAAALTLRTGVVDGGAAHARAIAARCARATIDEATVVGRTLTRSVDASNSIFLGAVTAERRQHGCLRYCSLPAGPVSRTPQRFRCQPDLAVDAAGEPGAGDADANAARARVAPTFTSLAFAHPGYTQLGLRCPDEIAAGGEDGAEMGVWHHLRQPQRRANLATALDEYLRAGLEAGPWFES